MRDAVPYLKRPFLLLQQEGKDSDQGGGKSRGRTVLICSTRKKEVNRGYGGNGEM